MHRLTYNDKPIWFTVMGQRRNFVDRLSLKKEYQPRFEARLDKNHWLLFADYDHLPTAFGSWALLEEYLKRLPVHVFKSYSGKPKAVILVTSASMSIGKAIDTLRSVLGEAADGIDKQGVLNSYIRPQYFTRLQKWLNTATSVEAIHDRATWRMKEVKRHTGINEAENRVLRFAASYEKEGPVALPQSFVAQETGLSLAAVNRAIRILIKKRMLLVTDKTYTPGKSAMEYEVIAVHLYRGGNRLQGIVFKEPPPFIPDGEWFKTIWTCTNLFQDVTGFMGWVNTLPGLHKAGKYRLKRAKDAWDNHKPGRIAA